MAKVFLFIAIFIGYIQNLYAQLPCSQLPTADQLLQSLQYKPTGAHTYDYELGCNVTDSVKNRLLYLLNWQWTKEELNHALKINLDKNSEIFRIEERAKIASKGNDSLYKVATDSIENIVNEERLKDLGADRSFMVAGGIILTVAKLNFKEAIPTLKKALKDSVHYDTWAVELALARLGDKKLQEKLINSCGYDSNLNYKEIYSRKVGPTLFFIATQESIYKLHEWMDTATTYPLMAGRKLRVRFGYTIIQNLVKMILNEDFQREVNNNKEMMRYKSDKYLIAFCREWLIKNKGNYKLNKNYTFYW